MTESECDADTNGRGGVFRLSYLKSVVCRKEMCGANNFSEHLTIFLKGGVEGIDKRRSHFGSVLPLRVPSTLFSVRKFVRVFTERVFVCTSSL